MRATSVLSVALLVGTLVAASACGRQSGVSPGGPARGVSPSPVSMPAACHGKVLAAHHSQTLTEAANGTTVCLAPTSSVLVVLHGSTARKWSPVRSSSGVLAPAANGRLMLVMGATGAAFRAVRPGTATLLSTRPACSPSKPGGVACDALLTFRATVLVVG
jgi:hypothetical protein